MDKDSVMLKKQYWSYVCTYAFSYLSGAVCGFIDGWFASRYLSADEIAASGLCLPYFYVILIFVAVFAVGMQSECTKRLSNGDSEGSSRIFSVVMEITVLLACGIMAFGLLCSPLLCRLLGAGSENSALAQGVMAYNRGFFPGLPALTLCPILPVAINICGGKQYAALATLIQTVVDFALNYLAIHVFHAGLEGLAWATTGSVYCALAILLYFMICRQQIFCFHFVLPTVSNIRDITRGGLPSCIRKMADVLSMLFVNQVFLVYGSEQVAARFIVVTVAVFFLSVEVGISSTLHLMSQLFFQEENVRRIRWIAGYTLRGACLIGGGMTLIAYMFAPQLICLFVTDMEILGPSIAGLRMYAFVFVFLTITESLFLFVQASGNFTAANLYAASGKLMLVCAALPMSKMFGITGVWLSFTAAELLTILFYMVHRYLYAVRHHISFRNSLFLISEELETSGQNSMEWTITAMDDAIGISRQVETYLHSRGADKRRSYYAALGIEEMSVIFAEKAAQDQKPHHCMIFLMYKPEEILIRFRDDCQIFNIRQQYETLRDNEDPAAHIGIRLLFRIARQLDYSSMLNLNMVVLRI